MGRLLNGNVLEDVTPNYKFALFETQREITVSNVSVSCIRNLDTKGKVIKGHVMTTSTGRQMQRRRDLHLNIQI